MAEPSASKDVGDVEGDASGELDGLDDMAGGGSTAEGIEMWRRAKRKGRRSGEFGQGARRQN